MGGNESKQDVVESGKACPFIQENTGELLEYSVVYTDRASNLMSVPFQQCMRDISSILKDCYKADAVAIIPGSGTYAMEATARQFGTGKKCMILRNGFFSFRWSEIIDVCKITGEQHVLKARCLDKGDKPSMKPIDVEEVVKLIEKEKPDVFFAPQVETSTGIIIPEDYIQKVAEAVHKVGGLFVLDSIAAGTIWVDMKKLGIDVLITAPQKGWSGPACCGIVLMNEKAKSMTKASTSTSFSISLNKWLEVMEKYEAGGFMYYTTLPTDALLAFRKVMIETRDELGLDKAMENAKILGSLIREIMKKNDLKSVAPTGFEAPTVVVCYSESAEMVPKFKAQGLQIAGGVPFKCDEPANLKTFRIGLFGIDKLKNPERTAAIFEAKLQAIMNE